MPDKFERLINEAITEKMNEITVADQDIELGWSKLQNKMRQTKKRKLSPYRRVAILIIGVISSIFMINAFTVTESEGWQKLNFISIFKKQDAITINTTSTLSNTPYKEQNTILTNIEEARNLVPFRIKELPFETDKVLIHIMDPVYLVEISYDNERILFTQFQAGLESKQGVNIHPDSIVEEVIINGQEYIIVAIGGKKGKAIWSANSINYTIDFYYTITIDEIKEMLKAMD